MRDESNLENQNEKRINQMKEMVNSYDGLSERAKGHLIGTINTIFSLYAEGRDECFESKH